MDGFPFNVEPLVRPPHLWMARGIWWCTCGPIIGTGDSAHSAYRACMETRW